MIDLEALCRKHEVFIKVVWDDRDNPVVVLNRINPDDLGAFFIPTEDLTDIGKDPEAE